MNAYMYNPIRLLVLFGTRDGENYIYRTGVEL